VPLAANALRHISLRPLMDMPLIGCFLYIMRSSSMTRSCCRCVRAT
jgi:hypothetical protein